MTWNYRMVKRVQAGETSYTIHEAFYDAEGKVENITEDSVRAFGETPDELFEDLNRMKEAYGRPVLDYDTMEDL